MKKLAICLSCLLAAPALADNTSGFYLGGDLSKFDADFQNLPITGDGTAFGLHAGYRHSFQNAAFLEGELFAASMNGSTNSGNTDFERYSGLTAGVGGYFTDSAYALVFGGFASVTSKNPATGTDTDNGNVFGVGIGYDINANSSIALRYSRAKINGNFGDVNADMFGLRYSFRF